MQNGKVSYIVKAGLVAALYAVLTVILAPISFGLVQCRVSEALCVLPAVLGSSVPGLALGCLIANLITGAPVYDIIFGSVATLIGAIGTAFLSKRNMPVWTFPFPAILSNGLIVGTVLALVYEVPASLLVCMLSVTAGEAVAMYALGLPFLYLIRKKNWDFLHD